eukprot:GHVU01193810.1.p1 GENE.GHVU01193810.1~~GHVU01193810.1.p1  ORF type:complete len:131 (-),score=22.82 GHVU01193810.1:14-406(-)
MRPPRSASRRMARATRSFTLPPPLRNSAFPKHSIPNSSERSAPLSTALPDVRGAPADAEEGCEADQVGGRLGDRGGPPVGVRVSSPPLAAAAAAAAAVVAALATKQRGSGQDEADADDNGGGDSTRPGTL